MKNFKLITFLLLTLMAGQVMAKARVYKIEVLLFSQDMPSSEVFEQTESQIEWPRRLKSLSAYKQVGAKFMRLQGSNASMARSQQYQPLMHVAWFQSVGSHSYSQAVQLTDAVGAVNGYFRLQRGNLLHMIVDLEYSRGGVIYRLNEKRRFKLNETHYLDHPKFGVLARVSPVN